MADRALPYEEPGITTILILSSFLYLLNIINDLLDQWIYCGLLGQVFVGVAWGAPGARLLAIATQQVFTQLGYLGLLLLVYEGGLSTSFASLKANLFLSVAVATTGICLPIGLSFSLLRLGNATPLQAFAAGAALCSTSLGTTFTVLKTSGLTKSRLGVVLTSAAMMDDVVGLVMVQIISNLKPGDARIAPTTVLRPVFVSLAFAIIVPICCRCIVLPGRRYLESSKVLQVFSRVLLLRATPFVLHTSTLLAFITGASYAGTSNLFAAYLAGAVISWWDTVTGPVAVLPDPTPMPTADTDLKYDKNRPLMCDKTCGAAVPSQEPNVAANLVSKTTQTTPETTESTLQGTARTGVAVYQQYYSSVVDKILKPLFFASIGFSIPVSLMFRGKVIWHGIVYACLMAIGKLFCGLWLIRFDTNYVIRARHTKQKDKQKAKDVPGPQTNPPTPTAKAESNAASPPKPKSLYPAAILGSAMIARGEIGFLVAAIAQHNGIFDSVKLGPRPGGAGQDLFLIVTWAIMLCTVIGPVAVGLIVRRVRRLQSQRQGVAGQNGPPDPLGIWGLDSG